MRRIPAIATAVGAAAMIVGGCTSPPRGLEPQRGFQINRYLGTWYEIARLDHSFERGLSHVTAHYSRRPDGDIQVVNRGYNAAKEKWSESRGRARFRGDPDVASLKVTFFWPFWGGYHVIALDPQAYSYAMVTSSKRSYLWILARDKQIEPEILDDLLAKAKAWGFQTEDLIFVEQ